jgi:thiol-disulfide isomerase/thioredoxin
MVAAMMKNTTRKYVWILIANALLLAAVAGVFQFRLRHMPPAAPGGDAAVPQAAAQTLPRAEYLAGLSKTANLADIKGQWTLVNLWASWCPPCLKEMPSPEQLAKDYESKGLRIIAISLDEVNSPAEVEAILQKHKFGTIARNWDSKQEIYAKLNPEGLPVTYLIAPDGRIATTMEGDRDWSAPEIRASLDTFITSK